MVNLSLPAETSLSSSSSSSKHLSSLSKTSNHQTDSMHSYTNNSNQNRSSTSQQFNGSNPPPLPSSAGPSSSTSVNSNNSNNVNGGGSNRPPPNSSSTMKNVPTGGSGGGSGTGHHSRPNHHYHQQQQYAQSNKQTAPNTSSHQFAPAKSSGGPGSQQQSGQQYNNHHHNNNYHHSNQHHGPNYHHQPHHPHHPPGHSYKKQPGDPKHQQQQQQQQSQQHEDTFDHSLFEAIVYPFCVDHSRYEQVAKIGQGTFGEVHKAKCKKTGELVALKKILTENEKEGFPITALREIKILQLLKHENIVRLIDICTTKATAANKYKSQFYLVFEFCEHDLAGLLSNQHIKFSLGEQKKIMQQLLNGLYYIHQNNILHRDIKTANILVTKDGKLKLADFGLARAVAHPQNESAARYTNRVVTLWYRPPELLLGERCYNKAIDMWGAGCIMAELWTRDPILKGNTEPAQLELIQSYCGSITPEVWPGVEKLELYNKLVLKPDLKRKVKERLGYYLKDPNGLDLIDKLLTLDPKKRIDSDEALDHDFFWTEPMPTDLKLDRITNSMFEFTSQSLRRAGAQGGQYRAPHKVGIASDQHFDRVY